MRLSTLLVALVLALTLANFVFSDECHSGDDCEGALCTTSFNNVTYCCSPGAVDCNIDTTGDAPDCECTYSAFASTPAAGSTIDLGSVYVGYTRSSRILVSNTGSGALVLSNSSFSAASWSLSNTVFPLTIAANSSANVTVQYSATDAGVTTTATFSFVTNDVNAAKVSYTLKATTDTAPVISLTPRNTSTLYFGNNSPNSHADSSFSISNTGLSSLSIELSFYGNQSKYFSLSNTNPTFTLNPKDKKSVDVQCNVDSHTGVTTALLIIHTNDPKNPYAYYSLSCWSVHMGRDLAIGFSVIAALWIAIGGFLWFMLATKK